MKKWINTFKNGTETNEENNLENKEWNEGK